ncbi:MAG: hypothetical protein AAGG50_01655 [Bacteroidota bacterium]
MRQEPHIGQYRKDKATLKTYIQEPFKRYRDDLVVNWVLPHRLPFETERGVFSRILKNDFGAGGSHHHLWMAFYRPGRKRLSDVQLSHAVYPDRFAWGLYVGAYAKDLFRAALTRTLDEEVEALALLNTLIEQGYRLAFAPRVSRPAGHPEFDAPLDALPDGLAKAQGIWVRRTIPRERVLALGPDLVAEAIRAQGELWPLHTFWADAE